MACRSNPDPSFVRRLDTVLGGRYSFEWDSEKAALVLRWREAGLPLELRLHPNEQEDDAIQRIRKANHDARRRYLDLYREKEAKRHAKNMKGREDLKDYMREGAGEIESAGRYVGGVTPRIGEKPLRGYIENLQKQHGIHHAALTKELLKPKDTKSPSTVALEE